MTIFDKKRFSSGGVGVGVGETSGVGEISGIGAGEEISVGETFDIDIGEAIGIGGVGVGESL